MTVVTLDDVLKNPKSYIKQIYEYGFEDINDGDKVFKNIQPRDHKDEFARMVSFLFPRYDIKYNFVRQSPLNQIEPNYIHTDDMMGDITVILYLNENKPEEDGTTIYDSDHKPVYRVFSKFNRLVAFSSIYPHSRNIFENFGENEDARLIQVIFLKQKNEWEAERQS